MTAPKREYMTRAEAAEVLGVGPSTVRNWAESGKLPCVHSGSGRRRYRTADVIALRDTDLLPPGLRDLLTLIHEAADIPLPQPGFWQSYEELARMRLTAIKHATLPGLDPATAVGQLRRALDDLPASYLTQGEGAAS